MPVTPAEIAIGSAIISIGAFFVSLITLWKSHLSNFSPIFSVGCITQRIYPIRSGEKKWFIVSLSLPMCVTNCGARPGLISDLRLSLHYPNLPIPDNRELIYATWEIDAGKANQIDENRFQWVQTSTSVYMAFHVLPGQSVKKHLIFEACWDEPVIQGRIECGLEARSNSDPEWKRIAQWDLCLSTAAWRDLANKGRSIMYDHVGDRKARHHLEPPDLHKYTGTKDSIPKEGTTSHPSILDYPELEDDHVG
jgi:hypothetical protein